MESLEGIREEALACVCARACVHVRMRAPRQMSLSVCGAGLSGGRQMTVQ